MPTFPKDWLINRDRVMSKGFKFKIPDDYSPFLNFVNGEVNLNMGVVFDDIIGDVAMNGLGAYTTTIEQTDVVAEAEDDTIELHKNEEGTWTNETTKRRLLQSKT